MQEWLELYSKEQVETPVLYWDEAAQMWRPLSV